MSLLRRIEIHLRARQMTPSRFGREAVRDPRLVADLRRGRRAGGRIAARVEAYLAGEIDQ